MLQNDMRTEDLGKEAPLTSNESAKEDAADGNANTEDLFDSQPYFPPNSLISPEDEKNVRRIWKSPSGC